MVYDREWFWTGPRGAVLAGLSRQGRCGFLSLVLVAMLVPIPGGRPVEWPSNPALSVPQDPADDDEEHQGDAKAVKAFLEAYHLEAGQILKRLPPPRPEGLRVWWRQNFPGREGRLDQNRAMVFGWSDPDHMKLRASLFAGEGTRGWSLRDIPRWLKLDLYPEQIEGDPHLLKTEVSGDWIIREGVPDEQVVRTLETIVQRALRQRITMRLRQVERDVVVARGQYRYSPLPGRSDYQIEIYGKHLGDREDGGNGSGEFQAFLRWVGAWIERPVVNEVEAPPKGNVSWHHNAQSPITEEQRREDHDEKLVLQHLHEQTGLTFTRERRPIRILFIERAK